MRQANVIWSAQNSHGLVIDGQLDPIVQGNIPSFVTIEENLFKEVGQLQDIKVVRLWIEWPDGSGHERYYEKRGNVWLKVRSDNIMPNWFGKVFIFGFFGCVALFVYLAIRKIYGI